jgi:hypothetical protein
VAAAAAEAAQLRRAAMQEPNCRTLPVTVQQLRLQLQQLHPLLLRLLQQLQLRRRRQPKCAAEQQLRLLLQLQQQRQQLALVIWVKQRRLC